MASLFRVKPYAHAEYKFVVRAKLEGKWKRRYFRTEAEAQAFAAERNAAESQATSSRPPDARGSAARQSMQRRRAIVTLGMHRSGTSALAGALAQAGVPFGDRLMPPAEENAKGFWEHLEIVRLHDQLLKKLGSAWDDEHALPSGWEQSSAAIAIQSSLVRVVERDFAGQPVFGLKDPRLSRLLPLWIPIFESFKIEPYFLLVVREPWEVAQSLLRRNAFSAWKSYFLWLRYTLEAEQFTRPHTRAVLTFDDLLNGRERTLQRILPHLGDTIDVTATEHAFRLFPERSLQHHDAGKSDHTREVPQLAATVYEALAKLSANGGANEEIDVFRRSFENSFELFQPQLSELKRAALEIPKLQQELESKAEEMAQLKSHLAVEIADQKWEVLTLRAELLRGNEPAREAASRLAEAEDRLAAVTSQRAQLQGMVLAMQESLEQERLNAAAVAHRLEVSEQRTVAAEHEAHTLRDQLATGEATEEKSRTLEQKLYATEDRLAFTQKSLAAAEARAAASEDQLQTLRAQLEATQERLQIAGKEVAARRMQIARLRERLAHRFILPFRKAQERLAELTS